MTVQRRAFLRLTGPDIPQDEVYIEKEQFVIGRLDSNDLALKHNKISRQHARFLLSDKGLAVEDLESSNGTQISGEEDRLEPHTPRFLKPGDSVMMGPFTLILEKIETIEPETKPKAEKEKEKPASPPAKASTPKAKQTPAKTPPTGKSADSDATSRQVQPPAMQPPVVPPTQSSNGHGALVPLHGIPEDESNWLEYLPALYHNNKFMARFLLIFEAGFAPYEWIIDHFDLYLDPRVAPSEFLQWFGSWVDILVPASIPEERQHLIAQELGQLFKSRGTRWSLSRHLELIFGKAPEIIEPPEEFATFIVKLPLGKDADTILNRDIAETVIESQRPIHTRYRLLFE